MQLRFAGRVPDALGLAAFGVGVFCATPAAAIDCAKASSSIEKRICANPGLKTADTAMGQAYAMLVKRAPDAEVRAMLVKSQRRWIAARDKRLTALPISALHDAIINRTQKLSDTTKNGLIAIALNQRRYFSQFPAAQFSGFETSCDFLPDDRNQRGTHVSYSCFGSLHVQNGPRLCDLSHNWATYALYDYYGISRVANGTASSAAYCDGRSEHGCEAGSPDWRFADSKGSFGNVDAGNFPAPRKGLDKIDAEGVSPIASDYVDWLHECVSKPRFPR